MFIGFDYGTSNCAVAVMEQGSPRLLTLSGSHYLPSTLHAPTGTPSPASWPKGWPRPAERIPQAARSSGDPGPGGAPPDARRRDSSTS